MHFIQTHRDWRFPPRTCFLEPKKILSIKQELISSSVEWKNGLHQLLFWTFQLCIHVKIVWWDFPLRDNKLSDKMLIAFLNNTLNKSVSFFYIFGLSYKFMSTKSLPHRYSKWKLFKKFYWTSTYEYMHLNKIHQYYIWHTYLQYAGLRKTSKIEYFRKFLSFFIWLNTREKSKSNHFQIKIFHCNRAIRR